VETRRLRTEVRAGVSQGPKSPVPRRAEEDLAGQRATDTLPSAVAELGKAADGLIELARLAAASGRTGTAYLS
jgi:hypothetical protein